MITRNMYIAGRNWRYWENGCFLKMNVLMSAFLLLLEGIIPLERGWRNVSRGRLGIVSPKGRELCNKRWEGLSGRREMDRWLTRSISKWRFALGVSESNVVAERTVVIEWVHLLLVNGEHQIKEHKPWLIKRFWWLLFRLLMQTYEKSDMWTVKLVSPFSESFQPTAWFELRLISWSTIRWMRS